jgi:ABC-type nitrate/sulfonate/bicarbonate transport system permease component
MSRAVSFKSLAGMAGGVVVLAAWVGAWEAVVRAGWISPVFLPSPTAIATALQEGWHDGLLSRLGGTVMRMVVGWLLASLLGIGLGTLIGCSRTLRTWLQPTLEALRPLPASALMPLFIALMGLSPAMVLAVIAFGAMWPVLLGTVHGFASIEPRLQEVARVLGLSRVGFIAKIGLPNAMPDALSGMRLSMTVSLILAVVGEILASQDGLGSAVILAARSFRSAELFAGVVLLGLIGLVSNALLGAAEAWLLRWRSAA